MQRRSKRLRAAPELNYNIDSDDNDVDKATIPEIPSKASKVKRSTVEDGGSKLRRTVKGKRGRLEEISQLPLDILFEVTQLTDSLYRRESDSLALQIFLQLDPIDILNLSRVSKPLRNILMRRSAAYIWKNARARIPGLPECPVDMSEPAYTNLYLAERKGLEGPALDEWCTRKLSEQAVRKEVCEIHMPRVHVPIMQTDVTSGIRLGMLNDQRSWTICETSDTKRWGEEISYLESNANGMWFPEHKLSEHKLVKQPKVLTERIWSNIKDALVEFMEKAKACRLDKLHKNTIKRRGKILSQVLETYASFQPLHAILPSPLYLPSELSFKTPQSKKKFRNFIFNNLWLTSLRRLRNGDSPQTRLGAVV
ncbi:hypothetical protein C0995_016483 [Termitomyces sp. Mi166|nr:hypothetical protein C0995_016483 [Termitomyces sp. Mi166\